MLSRHTLSRDELDSLPCCTVIRMGDTLWIKVLDTGGNGNGAGGSAVGCGFSWRRLDPATGAGALSYGGELAGKAFDGLWTVEQQATELERALTKTLQHADRRRADRFRCLVAAVESGDPGRILAEFGGVRDLESKP